VTRTLVKQCDLEPPTLAIAAFTHTSRTEYLDGPEIRNLGHWDLPVNDASIQRVDSPGRRFFRQYSADTGLQNLLINMVLFQSAMERRGIPYIIVWVDVDALSQAVSSPVLRGYGTVLNESRISRLSIKHPGILVDSAEAHPGQKSHERFAAALIKEFDGRLLTRRSKNEGDRGPDTINIGPDWTRASADRIARDAIRITAHDRPRKVRLTFGGHFAMEHFVGKRSIEIDLERRAWTGAGARLRAAYADYVTADLLRFNMWLNVLTAQEFIVAQGSQPEISVPECWFPERGRSSPVLDDLYALVSHGSEVRRIPSGDAPLGVRLDAVKSRLCHSRTDAFLRRVGRPKPIQRDDPNNYSLW
jgi:hypothetical protein